MSARSSDVSEPEAAAPKHDEAGLPQQAGLAEEPEADQPQDVEPATVESESGGSEPATVESESGGYEPATVESESGGSEPAPDESESDLVSALAERDTYLEDLQRVTAEFTNFRRQTMKRNTELVAQAASRLAKELLPVLDACEAAVSQGVEGIDAVQAQLLSVLSGEGLAVLGTVDEPFDPGFHEAVMSEKSGDDGQAVPVVAEVLRTGYAWNGRVLRPAMVKVRG